MAMLGSRALAPGVASWSSRVRLWPFPFARASRTASILGLLSVALTSDSPEAEFAFHEGDRIAIIGNALADRMQHDGWLEAHLHASHPDYELVIRNLGYTGDRVHHRPRAHEGFGDPNSHLSHMNASVIFAFFGYNESFADDPAAFRQQLIDWVDQTERQRYDSRTRPRIVLFSPIAHEDLGSPDLPDGRENNRRLADYTRVMEEVAQERDLPFVDLFHASQQLYDSADQPLTINGVHLGDEGNRQIARAVVEDLFGSLPEVEDDRLESVREAVLQKNWNWFNRYRATSGNDVWGSRAELHGNWETLQHELVMLDVLTANRDRLIWARAQGKDLETDDSNVPPPLPVESNFLQTDHADGHEGGRVRFLGGEEAIEQMTLPEGLEANLFASEEQFPELVNPVQLQVDPRGRIWVAAWATYPKWEPLKPMNDRLLILEDTTGDGVADKATTFAEVHNPTGFEFWNDGVIVVSAPDVLYLRDTDDDGRADVRIRIMGGIDSADTHHTANNVVLGADGYIYYQRGVFHLNNVETPWAEPMESDMDGLYRFNPRTHEFGFVTQNGPNAHGISFDRWGYQFITDATSGSAFQVYLDGDEYQTRPLLDHTVRPVAANGILSSGHLPEEFQNNFLVYNTIGFLGIKRYELQYDDGAVWGEEVGDLISSEDPNFRPVSGVVGADGAFYVADWHNPTVGHMQHNLRDPIRDHEHGRIYRITATDRPLQEPVAIYGETIEHLLDLLVDHPINGVRHRARIELSGRESEEVIAAAQERAARLDPADPDDAHALLELLWLHQQHAVENDELLDALLSSPVDHARFAAGRVARDWRQREADRRSPPRSDDADATEAEPAEDAEAGASAIDLTAEPVASLTINTIADQMRFDVAEFTIRPDQPVELRFENPDFMPHNLLITAPGAADEVYRLAMNLRGEGFEKDFTPDTPQVLYGTRLLNGGENQVLEFTAPSTPGEYPFLCSFPGHGELMRGVMKVVDEQ